MSRSQTELNEAAGTRLAGARQRLSDVLMQVQSIFSNEELELMNESQRHWEAHCECEAKLIGLAYVGGSIYNLAVANREIELLEGRIKDISQAISDKLSR